MRDSNAVTPQQIMLQNAYQCFFKCTLTAVSDQAASEAWITCCRSLYFSLAAPNSTTQTHLPLLWDLTS